ALFGCQIQEFILHCNKSVHTAVDYIGEGRPRSRQAQSVFGSQEHDGVLLDGQVQQDLLRCNKVGGALPGELHQPADRPKWQVTDALPDETESQGILLRGQIQQDLLGGGEAFGSLPRPSRQQGKRGVGGGDRLASVLQDGAPSHAALQHNLTVAGTPRGCQAESGKSAADARRSEYLCASVA